MTDHRVPQTRTSTDNPWRYCCPDCDSVDVRKRVQTATGDVIHGGRPAGGPWYCHGCHSSHEKIRDKKTGELVTASEATHYA